MARNDVPKRGAPVPASRRATMRKQVADRDEVIKAQVFRPTSNVGAQPDEQDAAWEGPTGTLAPPYEPWTLLTLFEHSNALRQCVDSYVTNIDAFGHRFEPVLDLNAADADDLIKQYILARRSRRDIAALNDPSRQVAQPDDALIKRVKDELSERMAAEGLRIQQFFDQASLDISFVTLRRRTRQDLEVLGNGYWECIRTEAGTLAGFEYVPGFTVRHMPADKKPTRVLYRVKENQFDYGTLDTHRYFRRYVQVFESRVTWFKEFGDPRTVSRATGRYYKDVDTLRKAEGDGAIAASELLHFKVHTSKTSYGIPRWIGTYLSVLGSRLSEEVNLAYFENKSVPPLAILVSGGRITNETVTRIQDFVENDIKGKNNFHKVLVLEGEAPGAGFDQGRIKIDMKPLTAAQHNDALFQSYDERNIDKVGMSFRLSRMLRGDIRDFNRATADAALDFSESQVFKPERDEFDFTINSKVLTALGVRFWRFVSNSCSSQNISDFAKILEGALEKGALIPAEARDLYERVFNRPLRKITAPWTRQPLSLTQAGIVPPDELMAPGMVNPQTAATGATVVAPGAPGAPLQATGPAAAPGLAAGAAGSVKLTGTDAASVVTVNEARADMGKGPLQLPPAQGGGEDPDGYLTVAEFKAKRMSLGQTQGAVEGQAAADGAPQPTTMSQKSRMHDTILALLEMQKASDAVAKLTAQDEFHAQIANADPAKAVGLRKVKKRAVASQ